MRLCACNMRLDKGFRHLTRGLLGQELRSRCATPSLTRSRVSNGVDETINQQVVPKARAVGIVCLLFGDHFLTRPSVIGWLVFFVGVFFVVFSSLMSSYRFNGCNGKPARKAEAILDAPKEEHPNTFPRPAHSEYQRSDPWTIPN